MVISIHGRRNDQIESVVGRILNGQKTGRTLLKPKPLVVLLGILWLYLSLISLNDLNQQYQIIVASNTVSSLPHVTSHPCSGSCDGAVVAHYQRSISIDSILGFISDRINRTSPVPRPEHLKIDWKCLLDIFYVVDFDRGGNGGVWIVNTDEYKYTNEYKCRKKKRFSWIVARITTSNNLFRLAWEILSGNSTYFQQRSQTTETRWPSLHKLMDSSSSFPFISYFGDNWMCCQNNWSGESVPIFTLSAPVECNYSFPMPSNRLFEDSMVYRKEWDQKFTRSSLIYPWETKINKAVWRGSLFNPADENHVRWRLSKAAFQANLVTTNNQSQQQQPPIFDVGFTGIYYLKMPDHVGGIMSRISPQDDFQKYRAILDADGNSWSERFGNLLCYNSVVLKVDPKYVDYFQFSPKDSPVAWKHYIPVKYDLSDLINHTQFALDYTNDDSVRTIVSNANSWCRRRLVQTQQAEDMLDIWDKYVQLLNKGGQGWEQTWKVSRSNGAFKPFLNMSKL